MIRSTSSSAACAADRAAHRVKSGMSSNRSDCGHSLNCGRRATAGLRRLGGQEAGFSLLSMLMAVGIAGMIAVMLSAVTTRGVQGARSVELRQDLESAKQTIRTRLDCRATLGITPTTSLPLNCGSYAAITLKKTGGAAITAAGKLGAWSIAASCVDNHVLIGAKKPGKDPLTGKTYASAPAATDLFAGTSDFCREYFDPSFSTCSGTYDYFQGMKAGGAAKCCRIAAKQQASAGGGAVATCAASEYVAYGGGYCSVHDMPGTSDLPPAFSHFSAPTDAVNIANGNSAKYVANAWVQECYSWAPADLNHDSLATAYAVCCPGGD